MRRLGNEDVRRVDRASNASDRHQSIGAVVERVVVCVVVHQVGIGAVGATFAYS